MNEIRDNETLVSKIVNADELTKDIAQGTVPQYVFYTPNVRNSGHKTNLSFASNYLKTKFIPLIEPVLANSKSLLVITFDESTYFDHIADLLKYNQIYTVLIGPNVLVSHKHENDMRYNHYSMLPTIQANWNLSDNSTNKIEREIYLESLSFALIMTNIARRLLNHSEVRFPIIIDAKRQKNLFELLNVYPDYGVGIKVVQIQHLLSDH
ncbi:6104_t:CDS:2 [Acaulospora colombiana]|uniref:6104_t:CDS:1 n=1 Tax=Acaulospora colombiana TaxID=27376 RepID=A0ACA9LNP9_9GLOM|nr:6104_t:CDS:2 [Acaulospora colombiana]